MKKFYSWIALMVVCATTFAQSQLNAAFQSADGITSPFANRDFTQKAPTFKFTQCVDTVYYVAYKDQTGPDIVPLANNFVEEAYQTYRYDYSNASARIIGVKAWVLTDLDGASSLPSVPVNINVNNANGDNSPGSQIYSESFMVNDAIGYPLTDFMFSSPVNINGSFTVSFEIGSGAQPTDTVFVLTTGDGDGLGENLTYVDFPVAGGLLSVYNNFADIDFYIMPIMEYDLNAEFYLDQTCVEFGGGVYGNNMSEVVADYMFNAGMIGGAPSFYWDFDDGNVSTNWNEYNNYSSPGYYEVLLSDTLYGWTATCGESYTEMVSVISAYVTVTDATCNVNDGEAGLIVSGGLSPYTYVWMDQTFTPTGETTQTVTGLAPGLVIAQAYDAAGCDAMTGNTISNVGAPSITVTSTPETCPGSMDASASVVATGGVSPYTYTWYDVFSQNIASTSNTVSGLPETVVTVSVEDAAGCINSSIAFLQNQNGQLDSDTWSQDVSSTGGTDGAVSAWAWGGVSPYTYYWSNGSNSDFQSGLSAGTYYVTVTDNNGCETFNSAIVNQPNACGFIYNYGLQTEDCGNQQGAIDNAWVNGGVGPFDYMWENGQTTNDRYGLSAGDYYVTITDQGAACSASYTITVPGTGGVDFYISTTDASCGASDGTASAVIMAGASPYSYTWMDGSFTPTGETTPSVSGLPASVVLLQIVDANGCDNFSGAALNNAGAPSVSMTFNDVTCAGDGNGSVSASASGGATPYTYEWSELQTGTPYGSGQTLTGLNGGVYIVTVTDGLGCVALEGGDVNEPDTVNVDAWVNNASSPGASDGELYINVWGGTGSWSSYTYAWDNGSTSDYQIGLPAGYYTVTVTDSVGCSNSETFMIDQPGGFCGMLITVTSNPPTCVGNSDGEAYLSNMQYGMNPLTYMWTNGSTTNHASGLVAGVYSVTVTDANSCSVVESVTLTDPAAVSVSITSNDDLCGWGTGDAYAEGSGGQSPYNYQWSNGNWGAWLGSLQTGEVYDVTATDNLGCPAYGSVTISGTPGIDDVIISTTDAACGASDGTASVSVVGGTSPFTFIWFNSNFDSLTSGVTTMTGLSAGTYIALVIDANGCDEANGNFVNNTNAPSITTITSTEETCPGMSNGSVYVEATGGQTPYTYNWVEFETGVAYTGQTVTGIPAGSYLVTVSDSQSPSCISSMFVEVDGADSMYVSAWTQDAWCNGSSDGEASAYVNYGGTSPFSYEWSNGSTSEYQSGLYAGTYTLTVTDANGCEFVDSYSVGEPVAIMVSISSNDATCGNADGDATVSASNGVGNYYYDWSNGQSSQTAISLASGVYEVTVSDDNGCESDGSVAISNSNGPQVSVAFTDVTCNGDMDGSATATVTGGATPYSYLWNDGATMDNTTGLDGGTVSITVTDASLCQGFAVGAVAEPSAVLVGVTVTDVLCNGNSDGTATVLGAGGTGLFTYNWSTGGSSSVETGLTAGSYTVTASDANGCAVTASESVSEPSALAISISSTTESAAGSNDASATASVSGGTGPYAYAWDNGGNTAVNNSLTAGTYTVTATDANNCVIVESVTILVSGINNISTAVSFSIYPNPNNGSFVVEVSQNGSYNVVVRNVIGQQVENVLLNGTRTEINLNNVDSGIYFVTIVGEGYERTEKVIVR